MDAFHERLATIGLAAAGRYGFALAGGYAVQAAGLLERLSEDVDLFTAWDRRGEFDDAVAAVTEVYRAAGLTVTVERRYETFARLRISDGVHTSAVELAADWRANQPVHMSIGPVLHPDDAVANKMSAVYGRAQARDFIDVDAAVRSGRYDWEALLRLAENADRGFDRRMFAEALREIEALAADDFTSYGVAGRDLEDLRARFAAWRAWLLDNAEQRP
jgi:hypothetical protein